MSSPVLLSSPLFTRIHVPHAFTTRKGGVSPPPFDSLNFGNPGDLPAAERDPAANIHANFQRLQTALDLSRELIQVHQVHAADVHRLRPGDPGHASSTITKADAIVSSDPSRLLAIRVADCVPVLFATADGRVVAAAHAGWRGVITGVVPNTLAAMRALGSAPILAAIGPCIGPESFEVGPEVVAEFTRVFGSDRAIISRLNPATGKAHVDLQVALRLQLIVHGVQPNDIDTIPGCTFLDSDRFFSHRRDALRSGRMVGVIGAKGEE